MQGKLPNSDIEVLDEMGFIWYSLEDVYALQKNNFDELLQRLIKYGGDLSPPKKYLSDPELGAWVTALRRLYRIDRVDPEHVEKLNAIGFSWVSPKSCGSQFMIQYREIVERKTKENVFTDDAVISWIRAQQKQHNNLSQTRKQYMAELLEIEDWKNWNPPM